MSDLISATEITGQVSWVRDVYTLSFYNTLKLGLDIPLKT